jgi:hypothetical protein
MVRHGTEINARHGSERSTALHKAAYWGHREIVLDLLQVRYGHERPGENELRVAMLLNACTTLSAMFV